MDRLNAAHRLPEICTARLRLIALSAQQLQEYLRLPEQLESQLGFPVSRAVVTLPVQRAINIKLYKMSHASASEYAWYTYWLVVITSSPFGAGLAGFKGAPDHQGAVELGYGIDPACQGKGYMTEAVHALVDWAFRSPACKFVMAETLQTNQASIRLLQKVGLAPFGSDEHNFYWRITREAWQKVS